LPDVFGNARQKPIVDQAPAILGVEWPELSQSKRCNLHTLKLWWSWYIGELKEVPKLDLMLVRREAPAVILGLLSAAWMLTAVSLREHLWVRIDMAVYAAGFACNLLAVVSNQGRMPVYRCPRPSSLEGTRRQPMTADTKFKSLCDIYRAMGCICSLGDLLMLFSAVFGLAAAAGLWAGRFLSR
jgi:hypothetical protein